MSEKHKPSCRCVECYADQALARHERTQLPTQSPTQLRINKRSTPKEAAKLPETSGGTQAQSARKLSKE